MQFKRPQSALVELFQKLLPETGGDGRTMFGCPCGFLGGNMFMEHVCDLCSTGGILNTAPR